MFIQLLLIIIVIEGHIILHWTFITKIKLSHYPLNSTYILRLMLIMICKGTTTLCISCRIVNNESS